MIITDPGKLVQGLKTIHKLWEDENPVDWVSQTSIENFYDFIKKKGKYVGITTDMDDIGFWYNAMSDNEDLLSEGTLTKDNVVVPKEKEIEVQFLIDPNWFDLRHSVDLKGLGFDLSIHQLDIVDWFQMRYLHLATPAH